MQMFRALEKTRYFEMGGKVWKVVCECDLRAFCMTLFAIDRRDGHMHPIPQESEWMNKTEDVHPVFVNVASAVDDVVAERT